MIHQLNPKACVDIKNDQFKAIKAALRLSRCHVHALMFEVGFYFRSFTITKPIVKEDSIYLGYLCPATRFICVDCSILLGLMLCYGQFPSTIHVGNISKK